MGSKQLQGQRAVGNERIAHCLIGRSTLSLLVFALCLSLFGADFALASRQQNGKVNGNGAAANLSYSYKFENQRFYIPLIEVDLSADGSGEVRFKRGESDELIDVKVKLLPATIARIHELFNKTDFLNSNEEYQNKKDFSHLGWVSLQARKGEQERKVRFNYTANAEIKELADIFRAIATQQMGLFDIELAEQHQPLDLPRQLETLENDLRLERIAEPEQVLPALREIASSDTLPLIARHHASRIITSIEKGKYKSPVKKN